MYIMEKKNSNLFDLDEHEKQILDKKHKSILSIAEKELTAEEIQHMKEFDKIRMINKKNLIDIPKEIIQLIYCLLDISYKPELYSDFKCLWNDLDNSNCTIPNISDIVKKYALQNEINNQQIIELCLKTAENSTKLIKIFYDIYSKLMQENLIIQQSELEQQLNDKKVEANKKQTYTVAEIQELHISGLTNANTIGIWAKAIGITKEGKNWIIPRKYIIEKLGHDNF